MSLWTFAQTVLALVLYSGQTVAHRHHHDHDLDHDHVHDLDHDHVVHHNNKPYHVCEHDKVQQNIPLHDFDANNFNRVSHLTRVMQSGGPTTTHPVKIYMDFSGIIDPTALAWTTTIYGNYVLQKLSNLFSVTTDGKMPIVTTTSSGKTNCSLINTTTFPQYLNGSIEADLIIYVREFNNPDSSAAASASVCSAHPQTNRPVVGQMNINLAKFNISNEELIEINANILIHETMHIFGFSGSFIKNFPNKNYYPVPTTLANGSVINISWINGTGVVAWAKQQYNCPTLVGVPLEDGGGGGTVGSHWETTAFGNEVMTGTVTGKMIIGLPTINFFQDSGLYTMNFTMAEDNFFGKNEGCDFIKGTCSSTYREFSSTKGVWKCGYDFTTKHVTRTTSGSGDSCAIQWFDYYYNCNRGRVFSTVANGETFGATSRCFPVQVLMDSKTGATAPRTGCFQSKCVGGTIQFTSDQNKTFTCNQTGQLIVVRGSTNVTCPNIADFCGNMTETLKCPNDCSGNGRCLANGKCSCFFMYSGDDCSTVDACSYGPIACKFRSAAASGALSQFDGTGSAPLLSAVTTVLLLVSLLVSK